jgi:hypothetical protein
MAKSDLVDPKNLYYSHQSRIEKFDKDKKRIVPNITNTIPEFTDRNLWANVVVVHTSRPAVLDNIHLFNDQTKSHGSFYVYHAPRTKDGVKNAVDFFTKMGMEVIDLPKLIAAQAIKVAPAGPVEPPEPKIKGIPSIANMISGTYRRFNIRGHLTTNPQRIEEPEYVFCAHNLSGAEYNHRFFEFGDDHAKTIIDFLGPNGGVCFNSRQKDAYIRRGAKDGYEVLAQKLKDEILTNDRILTHLALKRSDLSVGISSTLFEMVQLGALSPTIQAEFSLPEELHPEDLNYYALITHFMMDRNYRIQLPDEIKKAVDEIVDALPLKNVASVIERIKKLSVDTAFRVISVSSFIDMLKASPPTKKIELESLFLLACEG